MAELEKRGTFKRPLLDYTSRDFEGILDNMLRALPYYIAEWTDHNVTDFGIALAEIFAGEMDVLHYYVDALHNERFPKYAKRDRSVVESMRLIDYELSGPPPATVDVVFTIPQVLPSDLIIPQGTQLETVSDPDFGTVIFETIEDVTILAGQLMATVGAKEGETIEEFLANSNGREFQKYILDRFPVVEGSTKLFIDEGFGLDEWTRKDSFVGSTSTSTDFVIERDENGAITINLGDNVQGKIPDTLAVIQAEYRILTTNRGGNFGNVGPDTVTSVISPITFQGNPIGITVTNPSTATGGGRGETAQEAKRNGPLSLRRLYRYVSLEDFETGAGEWPGVIFGKAVLRSSYTSFVTCCDIDVFIVPLGGGLPTTVIKDELKNEYDTYGMAGVVKRVLDPSYTPIDISANIYVNAGFSLVDTELLLRQRLDKMFQLSNAIEDEETGIKIVAKFDQDVFVSDILCLLRDISQVDHVDLTKLTRQPVPNYKLWSGNGFLENIEIGLNSVVETWEVRFVNDTDFNVTGSVSGFQGSGNTAEGFTADNGNLSFVFTAGNIAQGSADYLEIKTSKYNSNIAIDFNEVPEQGFINLTLISV